MAQPVALLFPGQGAQAVGMGLALAEKFAAVAAWYQRADEAAGLPLRKYLREGPEDELRRTEILQPALLTVEVGVWLALCELMEVNACAAAGHSLGEYAALVAAGALTPEKAVEIVRRRGRYMQEATPIGVGGMAAVLGLEAEQVEQLCARVSDDQGRVWLSNDNCPGQLVISGHLAALERVGPILKAAGAKRIIPLKVSAPFHCPLMQPAADSLRQDLARIEFREPAFPVIANFSGQPYSGAETLMDGLAQQVVQPVKFRTSLLTMTRFQPHDLLELGPGNVLAGLARRTVPEIPVHGAGSPEELEMLVKDLA